MERFELDAIVHIIRTNSFRTVVLQFPDDELQYSINVHDYLQARLEDDTYSDTTEAVTASEGVDLFIAADSTWGSSIDDVSAMHCDCDLLVYFGTDLSSSGSIPVVIAPPIKPFDVDHCYASLRRELQDNRTTPAAATTVPSTIIMLYEPSNYRSCLSLRDHLEEFCIQNATDYGQVVIGAMPPNADLKHWSPHRTTESIQHLEEAHDDQNKMASLSMMIGGLQVAREHIDSSSGESAIVMVYIGDKSEQLVDIMLRLSSSHVIHYSPIERRTCKVLGSCSKVFRERYGGVARVKESQIIGLLVGSMGLTATLIQSILNRLQTLILAANKRYYTFVMGRLNEAKLCNFPEVDLFCFISNDDTARIPPKTFHVPVITPYELELGLGAQEWASMYSTDYGAGEDNLMIAVDRVARMFSDRGDNDDEHANGSDDDDDDDDLNSDNKQQTLPTSQQLVSATSRALTVFTSPAADYFSNRTYKGLLSSTGVDTAEMRIVHGQYGIAAAYEPYSSSV